MKFVVYYSNKSVSGNYLTFTHEWCLLDFIHNNKSNWMWIKRYEFMLANAVTLGPSSCSETPQWRVEHEMRKKNKFELHLFHCFVSVSMNVISYSSFPNWSRKTTSYSTHLQYFFFQTHLEFRFDLTSHSNSTIS